MGGRTVKFELIFLLEVGARLRVTWQFARAAEEVRVLALASVALERVPGGGQAQEDGEGNGQLHGSTAGQRTADGCVLLGRPARIRIMTYYWIMPLCD